MRDGETMIGVLAALINALDNGFYLTISKLVIAVTSPYVFGLVNMGMTAIILAFYVFIKYGRSRIVSFGKTHWRYLILVGIIGATLNLLNFIGLSLSSALNAAILARTDVLFSALIGYLFFREALNYHDWFIIGILLIGSMLILNIDIDNFRINVGDLFFILSAFLLAVNAIFIKYNLAEVPGPIIAFYNSFVHALIYLLIVLGMGNFNTMAGFSQVKLLTAISIFLSTLTFFVYYLALRLLPVWSVRALLLLIPGINLITEIYVFKGTIVSGQIIGLILVAIGFGWFCFEQCRKSTGRKCRYEFAKR
ncbi:MAG: DMT family transporter [Dehalobacterium sp.]